MFVYIKYDANGWITDFKKEESAGYTKVFILKDWSADFMNYSDKFRYNEDLEQVLNPENTPSTLTLGGLNTSVSDLKESVNKSSEDITKQLSEISSSNDKLSGMLATLIQHNLVTTSNSNTSNSNSSLNLDDDNMSLLS